MIVAHTHTVTLPSCHFCFYDLAQPLVLPLHLLPSCGVKNSYNLLGRRTDPNRPLRARLRACRRDGTVSHTNQTTYVPSRVARGAGSPSSYDHDPFTLQAVLPYASS